MLQIEKEHNTSKLMRTARARGMRFALMGVMIGRHFPSKVAPAKYRSGQILPLLALIIGALLGVAALGVDVFSIYWNRNRLQSATDAAALAGATYLGNIVFSGNDARCLYSSGAQNASCTYALANGVVLTEIQAITPNANTNSITVTTKRTVPALFAKVLGYTSFQVHASATAALRALGSATGVLPIGLDSSTPYSYGQAITIHELGCGPGCWQGLALQSSTSGSSGATAYKQNLAQGCNCTVNVGDLLSSEPGAKTGPTSQGVAQLVATGNAADPSGTWDKHSIGDVRAAAVPLVNWNGCNGSCTAPVMGFAEVWITGASGSDINAVFIRQLATGTYSSTAVDTGADHALLLQ
jgi:hypothetical protein